MGNFYNIGTLFLLRLFYNSIILGFLGHMLLWEMNGIKYKYKPHKSENLGGPEKGRVCVTKTNEIKLLIHRIRRGYVLDVSRHRRHPWR